tara:strand:+ start:18403 stop:19290 length:888 start_codon:yes stop_codon:yes gene_type:complete
MSIFKEITLIIVTYNSDNLITQNLEILKKFNIIIIDNSSHENIKSIVKYFDNIKYIKPKKNLGYGKANNIGVFNALTKYVLIVNPDIILKLDSIEELYYNYKSYEHDNVGLVAPSLYDITFNRRTNGTISFIKKINKYKINNSDNNLPSGNMCCDFVVGCCFLIQKNYFLKLGGFNENFFMYFEDNDLCDKIIKNGKSIIEIPSSKFIHLQNSSSNKNFFTQQKLSIVHKISEFIYLKKNLPLIFFYKNILFQFFDYFQRFFSNIVRFRFNNCYKNLLRLISIILFVTSLYKIIF